MSVSHWPKLVKKKGKIFDEASHFNVHARQHIYICVVGNQLVSVFMVSNYIECSISSVTPRRNVWRQKSKIVTIFFSFIDRLKSFFIS